MSRQRLGMSSMPKLLTQCRSSTLSAPSPEVCVVEPVVQPRPAPDESSASACREQTLPGVSHTAAPLQTLADAAGTWRSVGPTPTNRPSWSGRTGNQQCHGQQCRIPIVLEREKMPEALRLELSAKTAFVSHLGHQRSNPLDSRSARG